MTFTLEVAAGLDAVADRLATALSVPPEDPFAPDVVAIPGDGVRTWLSARVAERLGIVANVEFVFPGQLVRRALGADLPRAWTIGAITWAIHEVMALDGDELGLPVDAVRARSIADLFDRYALHRAEMVRSWEARRDVDAAGDPLPLDQRWQPALWRRVRDVIGSPSDAVVQADALERLRAGRLQPDLPERTFLVGLASLPGPQLDVLGALSARHRVHVISPTPSIDMWIRLRERSHAGLPRPCPRSVDPTVDVPRHRLLATWGRPAREAHLVLLDAARRAGATVAVAPDPHPHPDPDPARAGGPALGTADPAPPTPTSTASPPRRPTTLLAHLQHAIAVDADPPGPPAEGALEFRIEVSPEDRSVQWHRCHGLGRQVEVLRDVIAHLLEAPAPPGGTRLEAHDIAILCPDVVAAAPLAEAVFAGDPERGIPQIPLRVADRSLRQDNPLLDATAALLELVDGRFRASDVLAFAARPPVRRRFGIQTDQLGTIAGWVDQVHVRWGLDPASRARFGFPEDIAAHTWRAGLDQLLLGAVTADTGERLGIGGVVPFGDIEGDDVELAGTLAELLHRLDHAHRHLATDQPVESWCDALRAAVLALCAVPDADSWQWRDVEHELTSMAQDSLLPGRDPTRPVPARELAALLTSRLGGRPGRARFGTGAITLSSLTAQRGVPHRVVCVLGLDGDVGATAAIGGDDLVALAPCVGDRDARSEARAHLLDAVLAATERVIICSSGRDVRSNAVVPPAVPLAELADLIDASAVPGAGHAGSPVRASEAIAVDHPRQAWSEANFVPGALGVAAPLSFDRSARRAALRRRERRRDAAIAALLDGALPEEPRTDVALTDLTGVLGNPVRTLLELRLGLWLEAEAEPRADLVPLTLGPLDAWALRDRLMRARLAAGDDWSVADQWQWGTVQQAAGAVPPGSFGAQSVHQAAEDVEALVAAGRATVADAIGRVPEVVPVAFELRDGRRVAGEVVDVRGHVVFDVSPRRLKPKHTLAAWLRLAALTCARPEEPWQYVLVGRGTGARPDVVHMQMSSPAAGFEVLELVDDLFWRARASVVAAQPSMLRALHTGGRLAAMKEWSGRYGESSDVWVRFALGEVDLDDLLLLPPFDDEAGEGWGDAPGRLARWAHRIWTAVDRTVHVAGTSDAPNATAAAMLEHPGERS